MNNLLVVEDEPALCKLLANSLAFDGFSVAAVGDGQSALAHLAARPVDLVVLDLGLPDMDGLKVLAELRETLNTVPVIVLTARGEEEDRLRGLHTGADDYLVKPFSVLELVARIRAVLRRAQPMPVSPSLISGPFTIHRLKRQVYANGQSLNLTALEFRLVELLSANPGVPFSREEIVRLIWGAGDEKTSRSLHVHIAVESSDCIVTSGRAGRGGYAWALPVAPGA
jgi:two-component system phosphate regulon response regulator PhoB